MRALSRCPPRAAILALAVAALATAAPIGPSVVRAGGGLVTVTSALYQVQPDLARVHVTIDAVSTSYEADTPEGQIYYSGLTVSVPPGSSSVVATSGGSQLATTVTNTTDATRIEIRFSTAVFYRQSYAYRITFDMVDAGGAADRDFRIGRSVAAFPVWAFGSDGSSGNSVAVVLPATFTPSVYGGPLSETIQSDGSVRLAATVTDSLTWFAYVTAERPGLFTSIPFTLTVGDEEASVIIRAWDDDPEWAARTQELLIDGLPALQDLIGLPWAVFGDLKVEESANRLGDYAGIYNSLTEKINVRYDADATVTLHEAAHIWFNDSLFRDRWIGEAWAEFYAARSAEAIGVTGEIFVLTDDLLAVQIPLNDWAGIGFEDLDVEAFAYAASYHLAELIYERTDLEALRAVWRAADDGEMAYQPVHATGSPRKGVALTQEGWQRLLDLLEERTGTAYDDLWSEWVVNEAQQTDLTERAETRALYFEGVEAAGDWELPELIRYDLSSWQFDDVVAELEMADEVLARADAIADLAADLDLTPPDHLQDAFEGNGGLDAAISEGQSELTALETIEEATRELAADSGFVAWVGLLFAEPGVELEAARDAWESGESDTARFKARGILATLDEADDRGGERLAVTGGVLLVAGTGGALIWRRRSRPRPPTGSSGGDEAPMGGEASDADGQAAVEGVPAGEGGLSVAGDDETGGDDETAG
ncbi:MAG: hypothetical protein ACRDFZ_07440 [Candidatus Limnocylindria bacterium]